MQVTTILAPLALSSVAVAWNLDIYGTDGRHVNFHGKKNSGCVDISFTPAINVKEAKFDPATSWLPDPTTFELYVRKGCDGLSYRNNKGDFKLTPARIIRSYKVTGSPLKRMRRMADMQERGVEFDAEAEFFRRGAEAEAVPKPERDDEPVETDYES